MQMTARAMEKATVKNPQAGWIAYRKPKPQAALRIFCFPYAGGGASVFRNWDKDLPPTIELCPVQLPGRETRVVEPAYSRIESLVKTLSLELKPFLGIPYVFFGYSMGALIAFELARVLASQSSGPSHIFLAARPGPCLPSPYPRTDMLSTPEFIEELKRRGGISNVVQENHELLNMVLPTVRADFALCENYTYTPGKILGCPLSIFGGTADPNIPEHNLAAWSTETTSSCNVRMFVGDHFFIHTCQTEVVRAVVETLSTSAAIFTSSP
jgi:medium-chain acyl-[acyl-carrier-protein] hydrolase